MMILIKQTSQLARKNNISRIMDPITLKNINVASCFKRQRVSNLRLYSSSRSCSSNSNVDSSNRRYPYNEPLLPSYANANAVRDIKRKYVPDHIIRPPYADTGYVSYSNYGNQVMVHKSSNMIKKMRNAAQLAHIVLMKACEIAKVGVTTDEIDTVVHNTIIEHGAYPSPLNYSGFPKSLCASVNEVICHGIPDDRPLQFGDVVSFDVSCYLDNVHGDNCATVIVGDELDDDETNGINKNDNDNKNADDFDWRGVPYKQKFESEDDLLHFVAARKLVKATRESLYAGIEVCKPGGCLSDIGNAIQEVADKYEYSTIKKYRGHGIHQEFHCAPYVKHFRNDDKFKLVPGMIFTIEPMLTEKIGTNNDTTSSSSFFSTNSEEDDNCFEWADDWTVATCDGSLAAQFEHTVLITDSGVEILTIV